MSLLSSIWGAVQGKLFPVLEKEMGEFSDKEKQFVRVCELCVFEKHIHIFNGSQLGRPKKSVFAWQWHLWQRLYTISLTL